MAQRGTRPATSHRAVLGQVLSELRIRAGYTQTEFAGQIGLTQSAWSRIERGQNSLNMDQFRRAAAALRLDPAALLAESNQVATSLRRRGVHVVDEQPEVALGRGLALIGAAAIAAVVVAVLFNKD